MATRKWATRCGHGQLGVGTSHQSGLRKRALFELRAISSQSGLQKRALFELGALNMATRKLATELWTWPAWSGHFASKLPSEEGTL